MNNEIFEAKSRLPLPQLMQQFGLGDHARRSARCPFHEDAKTSFSVWQGENGWRFKCHSGCGTGDEITFVELQEKLSNRDATKRFLEMSGVSSARTNGATPAGQAGTAKPFDWCSCVSAFTDADAANLAEWRGYSLSFVRWLKGNALVGKYGEHIAFPVHGKCGAATGAHYRLPKDGTWRFEPKGSTVRPLIIGDLKSALWVHVFESQWDALAVCDRVDLHTIEGYAAIVTRGAENGALLSGLVRQDAKVYAWAQNDPEEKRNPRTGKTPAEKWLATIVKNAGVPVRVVKTPTEHKDVNDWTRAGASADDLVASIDAASIFDESSELEVAPEDVDGAHALPPPVDAFYETNRRLYLARNAGGRWLGFDGGQFKKRLRKDGIRGKAHEGENLAEADLVMVWLQDYRDVGYAASLAGRPSGFYEENGTRFLVTDSPNFIPPEKGDWPVLRKLLENLFVNNEPEHGQRQIDTVLTWLKGSVEALRAGMTKEAQALALAGPPQSGKSLFQRLITHLLGGRECKPFLFMSGKTPFNAELFEAEHLAVEDEHMSRRLPDRLALGAAIKGFVANEAHSCHRKNCTPITLRPFWRLTLTLNDEPEALLVLPPLDEHVADKILLLRASRFPLPMPTTTKDERGEFWRCLMGELPAFLHYLLHEFHPPDGFTDARYVVAGWHHPELTQALQELSPSATLLTLIDQLAPWGAVENEWEGTAAELRALLFKDGSTGLDARRLLEWQNACGNYLATLAKKNPERVQPHRNATARLWIIRRP